MSLLFDFFSDPIPGGGGNLGVNSEALTNDNSSLYKQHGKGNKRWLECGTQLDKCKCLMLNSIITKFCPILTVTEFSDPSTLRKVFKGTIIYLFLKTYQLVYNDCKLLLQIWIGN